MLYNIDYLQRSLIEESLHIFNNPHNHTQAGRAHCQVCVSAVMRLSPESKDSGHVMMSSCVRLLSTSSPSLLKPAWADNKIRA